MTTGYGRDTWCDKALRPGRFAEGAQVVLLALYRRLITPRGMLRGGDEEAVYGFDVSSYIGDVGTETALAALPALIAGELRKDDRVADVLVRTSRAEGSDGLVSVGIEVDVVLSESSQNYTLTLEASNTTVELLGGIEEAV